MNKNKKPYNLYQIQCNCDFGWEDWMERNKDIGLTYFVFRYKDTKEYCLQECGIMHKIPKKLSWTKHAYMNITKMLNNNPLESKQWYIDRITKVIRKQLT